jgi:signal transduction histidine kinase
MLPGYAISSLVAAVAAVVLALVALAQARRARLYLTFAVFCGSWSALAIVAARLQLMAAEFATRSAQAACAPGEPTWLAVVPQATVRWAHVPPAFAFVTGFFAMVFVLVLTGYDERLDEPVHGVRVRHYVIVFAALTVLCTVVALGTDLVVAGVSMDPTVGATIRPASTAPLFQLPYGAATLGWIVLLRRSMREASSVADRTLRQRALVAFGVLQGGALVGAVLLPALGRPVPMLAVDVALPIAFLLGGALLRHYVARLVERIADEVRQRTTHRFELARTQERLAESEKLASVGALVAGVVEELNAPLTAVHRMHDTRSRAANHLMDRVRELIGDEAAADKALLRSRAVLLQGDQVVRDGLSQIEQIVRRLRSYARLDQVELHAMDVEAELDDALVLMSTRLQGIRIERHYGAPPPITCVARQISRVFYSVLANAVEALGNRGTLSIATSRDRDLIVVRIVDDGPGIPAADLPRVFEPGFTTKGATGGLGLGLANCFQIVHEHGGEIVLESGLESGTKVTIQLPIEARLIVRSIGGPGAGEPPHTPSARPPP